jgi:hypothetical protein
MGWSAADVDRASLWQFVAAWRGWRRANSAPAGPAPPSAAEFEQAMAFARTVH